MSNNQLPNGQVNGDSKENLEQQVPPKQVLITPEDPRFQLWVSQLVQLIQDREPMQKRSSIEPQTLPTSPIKDDSL